MTQSPYSYVWLNDTNTPEIINGPSKKTMYVTALYFTMTCMTVRTLSFGINHYYRRKNIQTHGTWFLFVYMLQYTDDINHYFSLLFHLLTTCSTDYNQTVGMYYRFCVFVCVCVSECCLYMWTGVHLIEFNLVEPKHLNTQPKMEPSTVEKNANRISESIAIVCSPCVFHFANSFFRMPIEKHVFRLNPLYAYGSCFVSFAMP